MTRCRARVEFDNDERNHTCKCEALAGKDTCYLHTKYEDGLCEPDYDTVYDGIANDRDTVRRITVSGRVIWKRER